MDLKNTLAAVSLSAAIIVIWGLFMQPSPQEIKEAQLEKEKNELIQNEDAPKLFENEKIKEITREELHNLLCEGFGVSLIHSEYGMTEILSQAYSSGNGLFECPPWMKILVRQIEDPLSLSKITDTGALNIIDLANFGSCPFIASNDVGKVHSSGKFEVLGRIDNSEIRGCNTIYS